MGDDRNKAVQRVEVTFGTRSHVTRDVNPPRELDKWERSALDRLVSKPFDGRDQIRRQLESVRVTNICLHCPTVRLQCVRDPADKAVGKDNTPLCGIVPFELHGVDADGMPIAVLVHVAQGFVTELEVYRGDSGLFIALPQPDAFELLSTEQFHARSTRQR